MDLSVNRSLLDPRFDGYKLHAADIKAAVTCVHVGHEHVPLASSLESKSYALTAAKFAFNNLLVLASDPALVAFIDAQWCLVIVSLEAQSVVAAIPLPPPPPLHPTTTASVLSPSLVLVRSPSSLPHDPMVVVGDGHGSVHLVSLCASSAKVLATATYPHSQPLVACDALYVPHGGGNTLHLSAYTLDESTADPSSTGSTRFHGAHLTFSLLSDTNHLVPTSCAPIWTSCAHPLFAHLAFSSSSSTDHASSTLTLTLAASAPIHASSPADPSSPAPSASASISSTVFQSQHYTWRWHQSPTDVTIHISLSFPAAAGAPRVTKHQIHSSFSPNHLSLTLAPPLGATVFSHAPLWAPIDSDSSLWTLEDNGTALVVHLEKREAGTRWPQLFTSSAASPLVEVLETLDPSERVGHVEQLDKYTRDNELPQDRDAREGEAGGPPVTMTDPKEDIDLQSDHARTYLARVDCRPGGPPVACHTLGAYLCPAHSPTGMCVKSDVDGLIYSQSLPSGAPGAPTGAAGGGGLRHSATAHALAYVQASKRDRRFSLTTRAWAAVAEVAGQVYVYVFGKARAGVAPQAVVECGGRAGAGGGEVVGMTAVGGGAGEGEEDDRLGKLMVLIGDRVVVVDVDVLVAGV